MNADMPHFKDNNTGLMHVLSHINSARRAGRTNCGLYIEFYQHELFFNVTVPTCIPCVGAQDIPSRDDAVEDRWEDVVARCALAGNHLVQCDNDGYCFKCGYQDDPP